MLQCVAVCCSVLQCVSGCVFEHDRNMDTGAWCVAVLCSMLQCVVVCCSVLQCVAVCCSVLVAVSLNMTEIWTLVPGALQCDVCGCACWAV